jgi:hypothetical protein
VRRIVLDTKPHQAIGRKGVAAMMASPRRIAGPWVVAATDSPAVIGAIWSYLQAPRAAVRDFNDVVFTRYGQVYDCKSFFSTSEVKIPPR